VSSSEPAGPTRSECLLVMLIVLIGIGLRCYLPSRMSVEQFDEGVYVSNLWFEEEGYRYPDAHLYAPPLVPWLAEWSIVLLGPSHWGCMSLSILSGVMTIGLVWWIGRSWFGAASGVTAAVLAAFSDVHILYSRTALTDGLLCFWLLLAVYLIWQAYRTQRWTWTIAAGVVTGLAWWTKYNGWLPLAIGLAGLIPYLQFGNPSIGAADRHHTGRLCVLWLVIAFVALVVWSPVPIGLQDRGGYAAVAANHKSYLVGLSGWWHSLSVQVASHNVLSGWLSCCGLALACLADCYPLRSTRRFTWNAVRQKTVKDRDPHTVRDDNITGSWAVAVVFAPALAACAMWLGSSVTIGVLAVVGIICHTGLWGHRTVSMHNESTSTLAAWLLAAWFGGLLVATPFYRPYPRLTLPWLIAAWLGAAAALPMLQQRLLRSDVFPSDARMRLFWRRLTATTILLTAMAGIVWKASDLSHRGVPGWQDRTGLEKVSARIIRDVTREIDVSHDEQLAQAGVDFILYVYAEPALFFHLSAANVVAQPVSDLKFAQPGAQNRRVPVFLITGPHAMGSDRFADQFQRNRTRFTLVREYQVELSDLVLLNNCDAAALATRSSESVRLYRMN